MATATVINYRPYGYGYAHRPHYGYRYGYNPHRYSYRQRWSGRGYYGGHRWCAAITDRSIGLNTKGPFATASGRFAVRCGTYFISPSRVAPT